MSLQVKVNERKRKITLINSSADPIKQISQWLELQGKINQDINLPHCTFKAPKFKGILKIFPGKAEY